MSNSGTDASGVVGPPMVYLPVDLNDNGEVENIRMARLEDGRVALLGYTALDRFVRCCGEQQPWMLFDTEKLDELREVKHYDVRYLDVPLPQGMRSGPGTPGADAAGSGQ